MYRPFLRPAIRASDCRIVPHDSPGASPDLHVDSGNDITVPRCVQKRPDAIACASAVAGPRPYLPGPRDVTRTRIRPLGVHHAPVRAPAAFVARTDVLHRHGCAHRSTRSSQGTPAADRSHAPDVSPGRIRTNLVTTTHAVPAESGHPATAGHMRHLAGSGPGLHPDAASSGRPSLPLPADPVAARRPEAPRAVPHQSHTRATHRSGCRPGRSGHTDPRPWPQRTGLPRRHPPAPATELRKGRT